MPIGLAFNLFVVMAHLGLVPAVYISARWLGLSRPAALGAAAGAIGLWAFDSWLHWCWYVGMVAYATASWLWLMPMALFVRWWQRRERTAAVGVALLMALAHLVHPYSFFLLVTPLAVIYIGARASRSSRPNALWRWPHDVLATSCVRAVRWWGDPRLSCCRSPQTYRAAYDIRVDDDRRDLINRDARELSMLYTRRSAGLGCG